MLDYIFMDDKFNLNDYKEYDYVYFVVTDDADYKSFESIVGSDIKDSCLYELINNNESIVLAKVA